MTKKIPVAETVPSPFQKRTTFDPAEIKSLADSISSLGLLNPIIVRMVNSKYEIIAGECRVRAHKLLGFDTIEADIQDVDDKKAAAMCASENMKRTNLSPKDTTLTDEQLYLNRLENAKRSYPADHIQRVKIDEQKTEYAKRHATMKAKHGIHKA